MRRRDWCAIPGALEEMGGAWHYPPHALWRDAWEVVALGGYRERGSQRRDPIDEDFLLQLSSLAKSRYGAANTMLTGFSSGGGMVHHMYAFHADKFDCFVPMSKGLGSGLLSLTPTRAAACAADVRAADDNYDDDGADGSIDVASTFASYLAPTLMDSKKCVFIGTA